jgi:hypothetical protein
MKIGYGCANITPERPMPLCGFAARCEAPFTGIDDPLFVRALAVQSGKRTVVTLVYDLLDLGPEIHAELLAALRTIRPRRGSTPEWVLCATHTHSAPAAITLLGCGEPQRDYWDMLIPATLWAAEAALADLRPARLRWTTVRLPGHNYNRRRVLKDGRVVMALEPDAPVRKVGPVWKRMLLARFDREDGRGIAGIVSWAAHAVTVCGPHVTADFPGEICRRLSAQEGFPFLYLQGACGDLNPVFQEMTRSQMLANADAIMNRLHPIRWSEKSKPYGKRKPYEKSKPADGFVFFKKTIQLAYAPLPPARELLQIERGMGTIARTGKGPAETIKVLANILNVKPGDSLKGQLARHIASAYQQWSRNARLCIARGGGRFCPLETAVLRVGKLVLAFAAAELFVETQRWLQDRFPNRMVTLIGYQSPLIGYLPTNEALDEGGYEVTEAYRFYNHPAPFAKGSERKLRQTLTTMIKE